ncbi:14183_t:CDS:2 [Ambispora leptoticha]|uniref:14183_t:CDS:1 n=1 Tax=Ambispora leptoticha TaxID=144679 RepID=A0A9N9G2K3_9GLOM|nr:14183_t:CDS:2 [Ambispora leptoticha]
MILQKLVWVFSISAICFFATSNAIPVYVKVENSGAKDGGEEPDEMSNASSSSVAKKNVVITKRFRFVNNCILFTINPIGLRHKQDTGNREERFHGRNRSHEELSILRYFTPIVLRIQQRLGK